MVSCAAFTLLWVGSGSHTLGGTLWMAVLVWAAGTAVVLAQMTLWTKLHPLVGISQSLGWLARFLITGLLASWLI